MEETQLKRCFMEGCRVLREIGAERRAGNVLRASGKPGPSLWRDCNVLKPRRTFKRITHIFVPTTPFHQGASVTF